MIDYFWKYFIVIYGSDIMFLSDTVNITIENFKTILKIPAGLPKIHFIQYKKKLTTERRFFFIEINKLGNVPYIYMHKIILFVW